MRASEPTRKEVRQARAFLQSRGVGSKRIPPRDFAEAARRMKLSFADLFDRVSQRAAEMKPS